MLQGYDPHQPNEMSSFFFMLSDRDLDIAEAVGEGLIAIIAHSRETTGGVLADVFCFDIADHQIGEVLSRANKDDISFNLKYDLARRELRNIVNEQASLLEMYVMSCEFVSNVFYNAYPGMVQVLIQEGKGILKNGSLDEMQTVIEMQMTLNNQLYIHSLPSEIEENPWFQEIPF